MTNLSKTTPLAMLTVGDLQEIFGLNSEPEKPVPAEQKRYVYGLRGIRELFGVSHVTAQRYKDTIIADAVSQQGRVIVTDAEKALELFKKKI